MRKHASKRVSKGGPKNKKGKRLSKKDRLRLKKKQEQSSRPLDESGDAPDATSRAPACVEHAAQADAAPLARPRAPGSIERVFEDADVLAIDKPAGMLSHPSPGFWTHGTVAHALALPPLAGRIPKAMLEERKASSGEKDSVIPRAVVHRLDRGTTGLMLLAKTPRAEAHLAAQFRARGAKKRYVALLHNLPRLRATAAAGGGAPAAHRLYVDAPIGRDAQRPGAMCVLPLPEGKSAVSVFHVHAHCAQRALSLVSVELHTGRQHQIRVHAARVLGAPVANDETYGERPAVERLRCEFGNLGRGRPLLHSWALDVPHPNPAATGGLSLRCPLPADMLQIIQRAWPHLSPEPSEWRHWEGDVDKAVAAQEDAAAAVDLEELALATAKRKKAKAAAPELNLVSDSAMAAFARAYKPPPPRASDVPRELREAAQSEPERGLQAAERRTVKPSGTSGPGKRKADRRESNVT